MRGDSSKQGGGPGPAPLPGVLVVEDEAPWPA